jgi:hypothetical protein
MIGNRWYDIINKCIGRQQIWGINKISGNNKIAVTLFDLIEINEYRIFSAI